MRRVSTHSGRFPVSQHPYVQYNEHELNVAALQVRFDRLTMSISVQLDGDQSRRLEELARELGVDALELAKAAVNDLLARPAGDFDRAAGFVLEKNRELYRRLS